MVLDTTLSSMDQLFVLLVPLEHIHLSLKTLPSFNVVLELILTRQELVWPRLVVNVSLERVRQLSELFRAGLVSVVLVDSITHSLELVVVSRVP